MGAILGANANQRLKASRLSAAVGTNDFRKSNGRGERIRTSGLLVPNQALYQAEPRPERFHSSGCVG